MITIKCDGDFYKTSRFFKRCQKSVSRSTLEHYAKAGVAALESETPRDTGKTANSWYYTIVQTKDKIRIQFCNSNNQNGCKIAIIIQYGHATGNGGYVQGRDYINPALQPVFDTLAKEAWKEVVG